MKLPFRPVIMELMNTQEYLIQSSYITTRTSLPLFTEEYHYSRHPKEAAHSHEFLEIGIILSGQVIHHTKEESSLLTTGCVYCIPIGQKHALESDREFTIRNLYLLPKILLTEASGENTPILLQDFFLYYTEYRKKQITYNTLSPDLLSSVRMLFQSYDNTPLCDPLLDSFRYHCLFNILLILCSSFYSANQAHFARKDDRIYQILGLIRDNLSLPTGSLLGLIADELSLNSQYINRLTKKELHTNLSTLILDTKIEKSCELLLKEYTVTEVANALAFYDHAHFYKAFQRKLGITPSRYQRKNKAFRFGDGSP